MAGANPRVIFAEGHIQDPVKAVVNRPMAAGASEQPLGIERQARHVVGGLGVRLRCLTALALDPDTSRELGPALIVTDVLKSQPVRDSRALADLDPPLVLMDGSGMVGGQVLELHLVGLSEHRRATSSACPGVPLRRRS